MDFGLAWRCRPEADPLGDRVAPDTTRPAADRLRVGVPAETAGTIRPMRARGDRLLGVARRYRVDGRLPPVVYALYHDIALLRVRAWLDSLLGRRFEAA